MKNEPAALLVPETQKLFISFVRGREKWESVRRLLPAELMEEASDATFYP
ncbi:MAG: hypothetical protein ACOX8M_06645 [Marvinbryantia sp.]